MVYLLFFSSFSFAEQSLPEPALQMLENHSEYALAEYLSYFEDANSELKVTDILEGRFEGAFKKNYTKAVNLGITRSTYWFKGSIRTPNTVTDRDRKWIVDTGYAMLKSAELYLVEDGGIVSHQYVSRSGVRDISSFKSGSIPSVDMSAFKHRNFVFDLYVEEKKEIDFILKIQPGFRLFLPLKLYGSEEFFERENVFVYFSGIFFGFLLVVALYNLFIYWLIKDTSYLYYTSYIVSIIIFFLVLNGQGTQYFNFNKLIFNDLLPLLCMSSGLSFLLLFSREFMSISSISKTTDQLMLVGAILMMLIFLMSAYSQSVLAFVISMLCSFFFFAVLVYASFITYKKNSRLAKVYALSFLILILSAGVYVLAVYNVFPANTFTNSCLYFGVMIQVSLLSLGLANQINDERIGRYYALIREHQATQSLQKLEAESLQKAMIDPLTGLPNRARLESFVNNLPQSSGANQAFSACLIRLKGFHEINHTLGFQSGDVVLSRMAKRVNRILSGMEKVLCISEEGQERQYVAAVDKTSFVMFFEVSDDKESCLAQVKHLLDLVNRPLEYHGIHLDVGAKAGIAFSPEHSTNIFTLIRFAQIASEVESVKTGMVELYASSMDNYTARKLMILGDLRTAIENKTLHLNFMPQLDINKKEVVGIEALTRWSHPEYGELSPLEFIPLAEKTGLIHQLTEWLFEESFASLAKLKVQGIHLTLSINISVKNLLEKGFVEKVEQALKRSGLEPSDVVLEVTETAIMTDPEQSLIVLEELASMGFALSLDDFGSGYSSLSYIRRLPLSEIKIDREFITTLDSDDSNRVITKNTITMCHQLGFRVCAEGIESKVSLDFLNDFSCDLAQGFFIAKPMRLSALQSWLEKNETFS